MSIVSEQIDDRFIGFKQLVGPEAYQRISAARVCVVGLGGVGSWTVEALVRSGVGGITLVDLDEVCVTNINRQLHALSTTIGASKAEVLAQRCREINPECKVECVKSFFSASTSDRILNSNLSLVIDTIDSAEHKATLLAECATRQIPSITVGSAGDRLSPLGTRVEDLSKTIHDPLLQIVRRKLRQDHSFPRSERTRFDIPCIYSPKQRGPREQSEATACETRTTSKGRSCNAGLGSAVFVTGTIGFVAAAEAIRILSLARPDYPYRWVEKRRLKLASN